MVRSFAKLILSSRSTEQIKIFYIKSKVTDFW